VTGCADIFKGGPDPAPIEHLQVSTWEASPQQLEEFLGNALSPAQCGHGNEAIELALAHASKVEADLVVDEDPPEGRPCDGRKGMVRC